MPTYHYRCENCGNELEIFQKMSDESLTICPKCKKETFERVISAEGGFVLKGSGFYKTDYTNSKPEQAQVSPSPCSKDSCSTGTCPFAK
ncbi:MAG: zinc ribbon domain-containing protein [Chlorobiaceae bacterium]